MKSHITKDLLFRMFGREVEPNVDDHYYDEFSLSGSLGGDSDWNHMLVTVSRGGKEVGKFWMDFADPPYRIETFITPTFLWELDRYLEIMDQIAVRGRKFRSEKHD